MPINRQPERPPRLDRFPRICRLIRTVRLSSRNRSRAPPFLTGNIGLANESDWDGRKSPAGHRCAANIGWVAGRGVQDNRLDRSLGWRWRRVRARPNAWTHSLNPKLQETKDLSCYIAAAARTEIGAVVHGHCHDGIAATDIAD